MTMINKVISKWKTYLPIFGLVLFGFILYLTGPGVILSTLSRVDYRLLLLLPVMLFFLFALQTARLNMILATRQIQLPFWQLFRIQLIGLFYATITPGKMGGMLRIGYIAESVDCNATQCTTPIVVEKFLDLLSLFIFAMCGGIILASYYDLLLYQASGVIFLLVASAVVFHKKERAKSIINFFLNNLPMIGNYRDNLRSTFNHFYDQMPRKRDTIVPFLLSMLNWLIFYSSIYIITMALGIKIAYLNFVLLYPFATIVSMLPITIAGLGTREITLITLFNGVISPPEIVSLSILSLLFCGMFPALIGWIFSVSYKNVPVKSEINGGRA